MEQGLLQNAGMRDRLCASSESTIAQTRATCRFRAITKAPRNALKVDFTRAATVSRKVAASTPWRGGMAPTVHSPLTVRFGRLRCGSATMKTDF